MQGTFNGQPLSFNTISNAASYAVYGADVTAYAGQTGQLLFTLPAFAGSSTLDNIQFSTNPVPEPGAVALAALGAGLLGFTLRRKAS